MNSRPVPEDVRARYAAEGADPVEVDPDRIDQFARRHMAVLLSQIDQKVRHDPDRLAEAVLGVLALEQEERLQSALYDQLELPAEPVEIASGD